MHDAGATLATFAKRPELGGTHRREVVHVCAEPPAASHAGQLPQRSLRYCNAAGTSGVAASSSASTRRRRCAHSAGTEKATFASTPSPIPKIQHPRDAIIKITACAICGSDLHLLDGYQPTMESGDILGHENMGEVVELGSEVTNLKIGDRVVVPFTISCGECWFCQQGLFSCCDRTNPNAEMAAKAMGHSPAGLFGFSHMLGGYSGGQAEYLRVPMADVGPIKVPDSVTDEQALFLSDIFPTGYMAAENAQIEDGDTVAIWGCGPVGQFAIRSALMMGAGRVIAIDEVPERLAMAEAGGAETIDFSKIDVYDELMARTDKRGPDSCIDAVGCEASGHGAADAVLDKVKAAAYARHRPGARAARGDHVLPQGRARSRSPASMSAWPTRSRSARR